VNTLLGRLRDRASGLPPGIRKPGREAVIGQQSSVNGQRYRTAPTWVCSQPLTVDF
jgi:hypothetical protein